MENYSYTIIIFIFPLLSFLDKNALAEHIRILWILLPGTAIYIYSFIPNYNLYVKHKDILLMSISIIGSAINCILNYYFINR